jgi:hypothetical protein
MRQLRPPPQGSSSSYQNLEAVDLSTKDYLPKHATRGIWCGADGLIRVLMYGAQVEGAGNPQKRNAEDDAGVDAGAFKTRAITIPVFKGDNAISCVRIYMTGTDSALATAGIFASF